MEEHEQTRTPRCLPVKEDGGGGVGGRTTGVSEGNAHGFFMGSW